MVEEITIREWEIRLQELDMKEQELKSRADEFQREIENLETELSKNRIKRYRTEILSKIKRGFVRIFRERDNLLNPLSIDADEWTLCSRKLRACIIIQNALDSEESDFFADVPQLKIFLSDKLNSEIGDNAEKEISCFLESDSRG
jgi:hypothetical protein